MQRKIGLVVLSTLGHVFFQLGLIIHVKHAGANSGQIDQETQPQSKLMVSMLYSAGRSSLTFNLYSFCVNLNANSFSQSIGPRRSSSVTFRTFSFVSDDE